jgi:hypothetical protein
MRLVLALTAVLSATLSSTPARSSPCRNQPPATVATWFDPGSLIIDMGENKCKSVRPLALAWYLLSHGIRISWVLDTSKAVGGYDLPSMAVTKYAWSGAYNSFVASADKAFGGGPLVIPAADADRALRLVYEGVLPQDTSVRFGWNNQAGCSYCANFSSDVSIYRATSGFTAPVLRTVSSIPKHIALRTNNAGSQARQWMDDVFDQAKLGFSLGPGTPTSPGLLYDLFTTEAALTSYLDYSSYTALWLANDATVTTSRGTITGFVSSGGNLVAAGSATGQLDADPSSRYMTTSPLLLDKGNGAATPPTIPWNPYTQVGLSQEFKTLTGDTQGFHLGAANDFLECVILDIKKESPPAPAEGSYSLLIRDDQAVGGTVLYIAGSNYGNTCSTDNKATWQRTLLNLLFGAGVNPAPREVTRSTPVIVENESGPRVISFQGTVTTPFAYNNTVFDPARPGDWVYPAITGHLRAYDMSASPSIVDLADQTTLWDAAPRNKRCNSSSDCSGLPCVVGICGCNSAADCPGQLCSGGLCVSHIPASRNLYTASAAGTGYGLSREPFTAANVASLQAALGYPGSAASASALIGRVALGQLGGVDRSTPAYIPGGDKITYSGSYKRPAVLYAAALDGMLHAFRVPDIENTAPASWDWTASDELWAFIPPDQLGLLRFNDQALQSSPAVADLFGAFLENDGTPSAARPAASRDTTQEWVTVLALATNRKDGSGALQVLDVTNPEVGSTSCPQQWAGTIGNNCVHGPNPLWVRTGSGGVNLGRATGASIGVIRQAGALKTAIFVATDLHNAGTGGGMRLFAFDAATGDDLWPQTRHLTFQYKRTRPGLSTPANEPPATPVLVDKSGGLSGFQSHLYLGDFEGKIWEIGDLGSDPPTIRCLWDANAKAACTAWSCSGGTCTNPSAGTVNYPLAAPLSVYFLDSAAGSQLHLVFATGGAYWAPASAAVPQYVGDINITGSPGSATTLASLSETFGGSTSYLRAYAAPVMMNRDIYVSASAGLGDLLGDWDLNSNGALYRFTVQLSSGTFEVVSSLTLQKGAGLSGTSSLGLTRDQSKVVVTGMARTGVVTPAGTGSGAGSTSPNQGGTGLPPSAGVKVWLPSLR